MTRAALVWDERLASYSFGPEHPLNPRRLELTVSLCSACGLLDESVPVLAPRPATEEELARVHAPEFIEIVKQLSVPGADPRAGLRYGLGTDDDPIVPGMHDAAALIYSAATTGDWITTWQMSLTKTDPDKALVFFWQVMNIKRGDSADPRSTVALAFVGALTRTATTSR